MCGKKTNKGAGPKKSKPRNKHRNPESTSGFGPGNSNIPTIGLQTRYVNAGTRNIKPTNMDVRVGRVRRGGGLEMEKRLREGVK